MSNSRSSYIEPHTPMTTFTRHTKSTATSESQTTLIKVVQRNASAYPIFKNDLYYDTFQRSFLAIIKAQGLYDVAGPDYDPGDGETIYTKTTFVPCYCSDDSLNTQS